MATKEEERARSVLEFLCHAPVDQYGRGGKVTGEEIADGTGLSTGEINPAVELLGERRQIRIHEDAGAFPYDFASVELTEAGREIADPTIKRDAEVILAFLGDRTDGATGSEIEAETGLTPARINHGVDYLDWRGYLNRSRCLRTAPYTFKLVQPTVSGTRKRERALSKRQPEAVLSPL